MAESRRGIYSGEPGLHNDCARLSLAASSNPLSASDGTYLLVFFRRRRLGCVVLGRLAADGHNQLVVSFDRTPNANSVLDGRESALG